MPNRSKRLKLSSVSYVPHYIVSFKIEHRCLNITAFYIIAQIKAFFINPRRKIATRGEKSIPIAIGGSIC
jgi:hypothetical protein|tara:strand:+ start:158 stop:367 length:210 start_codon:yes stop_codon:yes gene_type:complete